MYDVAMDRITLCVSVLYRVTKSLPLSYHPDFKFSDSTGERRKAARVRGVLLPQEYDLERLVSNIVNPLPSWNASVPAHKWEGITCSDEGEILRFEIE